MKKLILLASFAVLAACSQGASEPAADAGAEAVAASETAVPVIAPGTYDFTFANDWAPTILTLNTDGTFSETGDGIGQKNGTWNQQDVNLCKTDDTEECWVKKEELPSGAIVVTRAGVTGTLTKRVEAAAAAPAPAVAPEVVGTLAEARALPTGTYSQSCEGAKLDGVVMSAQCRNVYGQAVASTLDLTDCAIGHNVMNDNGALACRVG